MKNTVIILSSDYKPNIGGIAEWTYQVAIGFTEYGWRVLLFAPDIPSKKNNDDKIANSFMTFRIMPVTEKEANDLIIFSYKLFLLVRCLYLNSKKYTIKSMLATDVGVYAGLKGLLVFIILRLFKYDMGIVFHGLDLKDILKMNRLKKRCFLYIIKRVNNIYCNSNHTAETIRSAYPQINSPIAVGCGIRKEALPNRVEYSAARNALGITEKYVILTVARLIPRKGIDMVIKSMPLILRKHADVLYLIAGGGKDLERLTSIANEYNCSSHVRFEGEFDQKLIANYYCSANVFIMASRETVDEGFEGFGIVFGEAAHYGIPVIGGKSGGIPDAIIDGVTGILVNPEDRDEIASAIIRILESPEYGEKLGLAGKKRTERELTWNNVVKKIIDTVSKKSN